MWADFGQGSGHLQIFNFGIKSSDGDKPELSFFNAKKIIVLHSPKNNPGFQTGLLGVARDQLMEMRKQILSAGGISFRTPQDDRISAISFLSPDQDR